MKAKTLVVASAAVFLLTSSVS